MDFHLDLPLNRNEPATMHMDFNSFFASVEQQANPLLRGKPVAVAAYTSPNGCILSPSIEAKRHGIKTGMSVREGRLLCSSLVVLKPDSPKYRDVHVRLKRLLGEYTAKVRPRSIDEAVLDFGDMGFLGRDLQDIATEIKRRVRSEIGDWLRCSVGISTNRFLAKTAAGLHKPDGLEVITADNLQDVYARLSLKDLPGINRRYEARLNAAGIFTTDEFLQAPLDKLRGQVFRGVNGYYWYLRLRGWEIDAIDFNRRSFGQVYSLPHPTSDVHALSSLLMKLCEKMGRRMRKAGYKSRGMHVAAVYSDRTHWHKGTKTKSDMYTTQDLYRHALLVFNSQHERKPIARLSVSCFDLSEHGVTQLDLFDDSRSKQIAVSNTVDEINDKYGELVLTPALMMGAQGRVPDLIGFGNVRELQDPYSDNRRH